MSNLNWREQLAAEHEQLKAQALWRSLRPVYRSAPSGQHDGCELINFAGNDYLALCGHAHLIAKVQRAAGELGVGAGASRLISGHLEIHEQLEVRFAKFKNAQRALLCPTGYMANLAAITTLAGPGDTVMLDKLNHASLIDAARASGATVRIFNHRGYDKLERLLGKATGRKLIVTDSVFSMDGDCADLRRLVELRDGHHAMLIVDEAHSTGVLGQTGCGLAEHQGVAGRIDITISTASKALGSLGGIITADAVVIDELVNRARSFIYTTAAPPTQAAAIIGALDVIRDEPERRMRLAGLAERLRDGLRRAGWAISDDPTPIVPVVVGEAETALAISEKLRQAGFGVPAIRFPTVGRNAARLRISLRVDHTEEQVDELVSVMARSG